MIRLSALLICLIYAILFVLLFSDTTSPLFECSYSVDSSAYMLFGKSVVAGKFPYLDIWELKGPAIFYLEAFGYWLTYSKMGICILQIVFLWMSFYLIYKLYSLGFSQWASVALAMFSFLSLIINYQGGNFIEEYTLPLLGLSTYFMFKWTLSTKRNDVPWHNPKFSIIYGFVLGFSLMTRLTDALGICGAALVIGVYLVIHRQWKNLLFNVLYYFIGFFVVVLPFCIYFYQHDALYEMWYGTFIFNLSYAAESTVGGISDLSSFKGFLVAFVNSYGLFLFALLIMFLNPSRRLAAMMWMAMGGFLFAWYINSNGYGHYGMLSLYSTCIILNELSLLIKEKHSYKRSIVKIAGISYILFIVFFGLWGGLSQYQKKDARYKDYDLFVGLMSNVPEADNDYFVAYNVDPSVYHIGNILPCYKYSGCQDWLMGMNKEQYERVYDEFNTLKAKWILVKNGNLNEEIRIQPILNIYYVKVVENGQFALYGLKEKNRL